VEAPAQRQPSAPTTSEIVDSAFSAKDPAEISDVLDEIYDAIVDEAFFPSRTEIEAWRDRVLPEAVASTARFMVHLAAVGRRGNVSLVSPDLSNSAYVLRVLKDVYWWDGDWHVDDSHGFGGRRKPSEAKTFGDILSDFMIYTAQECAEALGSYAVAPKDGLGHLPLVPASTRSRDVAIQFYSRYRRLDFRLPLINVGVPGEPYHALGGRIESRPAFYDEVALLAFPALATADASAFEYIHDLPQLEQFRDEVRRWCRIDADNAADVKEALNEVAYRMQQRAEAASEMLFNAKESGRKKIRRAGTTGIVSTGIGFITGGGAGPAWNAVRSVSAAKRDADPTARLMGTDLVLLTLSDGRRP
jgi:hypothetical protein